MKERLQMLMQTANISSNKLAELIGVQPSSISHILSGRNNPSYDFINKLVSNFPEIDVRWLLTGEGPGLTGQHRVSVSQSNTPVIKGDYQQAQKNEAKSDNNSEFKMLQNSIFSGDHTETREYFADDEPEDNKNYVTQKKYTQEGVRRQAVTKSEVSNNLINKPEVSRNKKDIERIVIFYNDGSYSEYANET